MGSIITSWLTPPDYDPDKALWNRPPSTSSRRIAGAVLCFFLLTTFSGLDELEDVMKPWWGQTWAARVVVHPPRTTVASAVLMGRLGLDAVVARTDLNPVALRTTLTDLSHVGGRLVDRLRLHGCRVDAKCSAVVESTLESPPEQSLGPVLLRSGVPVRTAQRRLRASGLPAPSEWRLFSRALRALVALQRDPTLSVERAALEHGYSDGAGLSHLSHRILGCRPTEARAELGWQPLVHRFLATMSGS